jgi:hypothetical protein
MGFLFYSNHRLYFRCHSVCHLRKFFLGRAILFKIVVEIWSRYLLGGMDILRLLYRFALDEILVVFELEWMLGMCIWNFVIFKISFLVVWVKNESSPKRVFRNRKSGEASSSGRNKCGCCASFRGSWWW